jgi:hypothetical protein
MLNLSFTSSWVVGGWVAAVAIIVAASMAMNATVSTTAVLFALGIAPGLVIALLAHGKPSASVGQILQSVETEDGRS